MPVGKLKGERVDVDLWLPVTEVESEALTQLRNVTTLSPVERVCAMPDVHAGAGATVGSVIAMRDAVSPSAVGVDIGCGMAAVETGMLYSELGDLASLRAEIERLVPTGFNSHVKPAKGSWSRKAADVVGRFAEEVPEVVHKHESKMRHQIGTLGGGNHFIEVCVDEAGRVWIMLHSGSRYLGKEIACWFVRLAKEEPQNRIIVDRELSWFVRGTKTYEDYMRGLRWAQDYAMANRETMLNILIERVFEKRYPTFSDPEEWINCHHNYADVETHSGKELVVTRKGAISARAGQMGIIPGSMGTKSYIVRGKGSEESLTSASHGAGRTMSRSKAKKTFTEEDIMKQTAGVECRKDRGILDEIPGAYKDLDHVMENQKDLVEIVHTLKAVLCVKG